MMHWPFRPGQFDLFAVRGRLSIKRRALGVTEGDGQVSAECVKVAAAQGPDRLTAKIKSILQRDDLLQAEAELWERLHGWANMPHPSDALRGPRMRDPVRVLRQMRINAPLEDLLPQLRGLDAAVHVEGLDRPLARPDSGQPIVRDLELVAWALVVGPEGLPEDVGAQAPG